MKFTLHVYGTDSFRNIIKKIETWFKITLHTGYNQFTIIKRISNLVSFSYLFHIVHDTISFLLFVALNYAVENILYI